MPDNLLQFCSSLQENWSVDELISRHGTVIVRLTAAVLVDPPGPLGRPGYLVMAEPRLFRGTQTAELRFESVISYQVTDELSASLAEPGLEDEEFAGTQFRCYSRSRLLSQQRSFRVDPEAARLKHYQLVTSEEVIDIVSTEVPEVIIRRLPQ